MPIVNNGLEFLLESITGQANVKTYLDNTNAQISVGDGQDIFDKTDIDLKGTHTFSKSMDVGFPSRTDNLLKYQATFGADVGNFPWHEWGIKRGQQDLLFNRLVEYNGTKLQGQSWIFKIDLTIRGE